MDDVLPALEEAVAQAAHAYYRLVLLVGDPGSGKTDALARLAESAGAPVVNVNLELSRRLLEIPVKMRPLRVERLLQEAATKTGGPVVVLDNLEVLFDPALQLDPLRALLRLARDKTVIAAWPGTFQGGRLTYAEPGHPEFRKYSPGDVIIVTMPH